jgi:cytochrome c oxidase subunit II
MATCDARVTSELIRPKGDQIMHKSLLGIAVVLVLSITSYWTTLAQPVASFRRQEQQAPAQSPRVIEISAKKYLFTPNEIRVKEGEKIELRVHSVDVTHGVKLDVYPEGAKQKGAPGLVFDAPDQNGKVQKGVDQILDFTADQPGTYDFKCARICGMGHGRMKGEIIVEQ